MNGVAAFSGANLGRGSKDFCEKKREDWGSDTDSKGKKVINEAQKHQCHRA